MEAREDVPYLYIGLFIAGGLCVGTGIVNLYYAAGLPEGDINGHLDVVGFTALDNITRFPSASFALPLVLVGVCCLVIANITAWKETDGY